MKNTDKQEQWRDIPNYEGMYQVSNLGRVRSLDRETPDKRGHMRRIKGGIKTPTPDKRGYQYLILYKGHRQPERIQVHQLVAMAFLGHTRDDRNIVVDHIDNDPTNNHLSNLQIVTQRYNSTKDKSNSSSKYTGVTWNKNCNKWQAGIRQVGRGSVYLGLYVNELDASKAYNKSLEAIENGLDADYYYKQKKGSK